VAYGYYWSEAKPALRVKSGDVIDVETMLTNTPAGLERMGVKPEDVPQNLRDIVREDTGSLKGPGGHILTGPIYVDGADSGDVLEVRIQSIALPISYGYNGCSGFVRELCERRGSTLIQLDRDHMTAEVAPGIVVPLRPFFGSIGVAPARELGRVSSNPPSRHAGNLDNRELVAGTTLYIPVFVPGALLEVGDGHAAQGDGEVDQTAIETNLKGRLQVVVRKDMKLEWPRAETATHWITMGTDTSLVVATKTAIREMVRFLQDRQGITQTQAYQAASMAADLHITQLVDGNVGVHMMIPKSYLRTPAAKPQGSASHMNAVIDLLASNKPVFGLYAPANPRTRPGAPAPAPKTPAQLAQDALAYPKADYIFDGSMERNFERGIEGFTPFSEGMFDAGMLAKSPTRLRQPLFVKTPEIAADPAKARERISQQLNLGVSGVVFVDVQSADEVKQGLAMMRFASKGGTRPDSVGDAPSRWGMTEAQYREKADVWPLNRNGELVNFTIVESKEGLAHVREIAAVPGIGVLFPGAGTLRGVFTSTDSAGNRNFDQAGWEAAIQQVLAACKEFNVPCGYPAGEADIEARMKQGFSVFVIGWGESGFRAVEIGRRVGGRD